MRHHYIITWVNGTIAHIYGANYINALYISGITPEMCTSITSYKEV